MKFTVKDNKVIGKNDNLVLPYFTKQPPTSGLLWSKLGPADKKIISRLFKEKEFTGQESDFKVLWRPERGKLVLVGLGDKKKWGRRKLILLVRRLASNLKVNKITRVILAAADLQVVGLDSNKLGQIIAENIVMANYEFSLYKKSTVRRGGLRQLVLVVDKQEQSNLSAGLKIGLVVGEQVNLARDLGNIPGGDMTPSLLANKAVAEGKKYNFSVKVLHRPDLLKLGMGAILGVAKGSVEEPKFIIMEYWGTDKKQAPYVLVGKGVTFDSGGLNLKPDKTMNDMHLDMLGAAAVISALGAASRLKLPVNVVGLIPTVENMPSGAGFRPGDLLKGLSGKVIEVLNTDAEGRLILSDALTYAERYQPKLVVDVATLTGACLVALGTLPAGLFTPDIKLQNDLQQVGELSGDYVWPLPMWEEYEEEIKGTFGEVQNIGRTPYGGAITAAMFLWQFAKKYPWAHLDIAGPMKVTDGQYLSKGASGVGVRFLVELLRRNLG